VKTWKDGDYIRYTADPCEISLVDVPCLAEATFQYVKASGEIEMRKFKTKEQPTMAESTPVQKWETTDGKTFEKKADAINHQGTLDADAFAEQVVGKIKQTAADMNDKLDKRGSTDADPAKPVEPGTEDAEKIAKAAKKAKGASASLRFSARLKYTRPT